MPKALDLVQELVEIINVHGNLDVVDVEEHFVHPVLIRSSPSGIPDRIVLK